MRLGGRLSRGVLECLARSNAAQWGTHIHRRNRKCFDAAICERAQNRNVQLPQGVADDLFALFDRASDADLRVDLNTSETYATGAKCLLEFLGRREAEYRDNEERR